jgi:hypothetical protein
MSALWRLTSPQKTAAQNVLVPSKASGRGECQDRLPPFPPLQPPGHSCSHSSLCPPIFPLSHMRRVGIFHFLAWPLSCLLMIANCTQFSSTSVPELWCIHLKHTA